MTPPWVLCLDEENERPKGEVKVIYSCKEEVLKFLLLPLKEVKPAVRLFLLLPSPCPPFCV